MKNSYTNKPRDQATKLTQDDLNMLGGQIIIESTYGIQKMLKHQKSYPSNKLQVYNKFQMNNTRSSPLSIIYISQHPGCYIDRTNINQETN